MLTRIQEMLENFRKCKLMVVGDLILDHYAFGSVNRVSPEAPIQILDIETEEYRLGGASNVAHNLAALGAQVSVAGVVGDDNHAEIFCQFLGKSGVDSRGVMRDPTRYTTVKSRLIAQAHHLLRTDRENRNPIPPDISHALFEFVAGNLANYDALILSDYAKGMFIEDELAQRLIVLAKELGKKVFVGPKGKSWTRYRGAEMLSANRHETEIVTGLSLKNDANVVEAARRLLNDLSLNAVLITLGAKGLYLGSREHGDCQVAADAREVFDVAGAGDTVLALFSLAAASGSPYKAAARIANTAAGIVVGKVGTATVSPTELETKCAHGVVSYLRKIKKLAEIMLELEWQHSQGRVVVFTNGCFDILHPGHIRYLEYCKSRGDILVVGLNSDASIRQNKGPKRPILQETNRAELLAALSAVDYVVIFGDPTPADLIQKVRPDILIKGSDWANKGVVGREFVESYGGKVELYELEAGFSTTNIIDKVLQAYTQDHSDNQERSQS